MRAFAILVSTVANHSASPPAGEDAWADTIVTEVGVPDIIMESVADQSGMTSILCRPQVNPFKSLTYNTHPQQPPSVYVKCLHFGWSVQA